MKWDIRGYNGMGPLYLGMNAAEVAAIPVMGAPMRTDPAYDGSLVEFRGIDLPMCNYVGGVLVTIDTSRRVAGVWFGDMNIYETPPREVLQTLERASGQVFLGLGTVLFMGIGLNVGGVYFEDSNEFFDPTRDQDDRGVAVFQWGAFDELLHEYKPFTFL
ncbi:hypothetical protein [Roseibaca calidilacus]|uniref:Uncharacterized protein n=1 Tax=Roseibaca calidilacus TaxID=1666912 RepID=A0ABM9VQR3_9RHOB|nr:hypothetical protein [Roseibaca calidilacus]CUX80042.1 hypothetical protein Ga0058931_0747 [Roseibaca calidilacus]